MVNEQVSPLLFQKATLTLLVGKACSGKALAVQEAIASCLARGQPAYVIDAGCSYAKFCATVGGSYFAARADGSLLTEIFGSAPFTVVELEQRQSSPDLYATSLDLPPIPSDTALVLDESWQLLRGPWRLHLSLLMQAHVILNDGAALATANREEDVYSLFQTVIWRRHLRRVRSRNVVSVSSANSLAH